jgi:hypothetical protein
MNGFPPVYDVSAAGSMAASLCASGARERAAAEPPPFAAAPTPGCAAPIAACRKAAWRRLVGALVGLISGPRLQR